MKNETPELPASPETPESLRMALRRAGWVLFWERLHRGAWMPVSILLLFAATALTGVFDFLPTLAHIAVLAGFLAMVAASVLLPQGGLARLRFPSREECAQRLEQENALAHRPLQSWKDAPALNAENGLWRRHRAWQAEQAGAELRAGVPRPRLAMRDSYALRVGAIVLVIGALGFAPEPFERLERAVAPFLSEASAARARLEIWVTPPAYTGRAPLYPGAQADASASMEVPENSLLVIQLEDDDAGLEVSQSGEAIEPEAVFEPLPTGGLEYRATLKKDSEVEVFAAGMDAPARWRFSILPDEPPSISLTEPIGFTHLGSLRIEYVTDDDYGVASASARIELDTNSPKTRYLAFRDGRPPSVPAASIQLPLSPSLDAERPSRAYHDLTAHPWAGLPVRMTLIAQDEAGQKTYTKPIFFHLPVVAFESPLAQAFMELRQQLMLRPDSVGWVARALNALAQSPETYELRAADYMHLRAAYWKLRHGKAPGSLEETRALLWHMALRAETGELSSLEEKLRAAREALERALAQGAPEEEIRDLLKDFRSLLAQYLREQARQNPPSDTATQDQDVETIDPRRIAEMLEQIAELSAIGAYDEAQELLSQLQDILENLQFTAGRATTPEERATQRALNELRSLERQQQRLLDKTFQEQLGGSDGEIADDAAQALQELQEALRQRLDNLLRGMSNEGLQTPQSLGQGEEAMEDAVEGLGRGAGDESLEAQSQALQRLREGRDELRRRGGGGEAAGASGRNGERGRTGSRNDPLGRSLPDGRDGLEDNIVPDDFDPQRARALRGELLRRMGESWRDREELNYFERLLRQTLPATSP